jgi:hypothetical protein
MAFLPFSHIEGIEADVDEKGVTELQAQLDGWGHRQTAVVVAGAGDARVIRFPAACGARAFNGLGGVADCGGSDEDGMEADPA